MSEPVRKVWDEKTGAFVHRGGGNQAGRSDTNHPGNSAESQGRGRGGGRSRAPRGRGGPSGRGGRGQYRGKGDGREGQSDQNFAADDQTSQSGRQNSQQRGPDNNRRGGYRNTRGNSRDGGPGRERDWGGAPAGNQSGDRYNNRPGIFPQPPMNRYPMQQGPSHGMNYPVPPPNQNQYYPPYMPPQNVRMQQQQPPPLLPPPPHGYPPPLLPSPPLQQQRPYGNNSPMYPQPGYQPYTNMRSETMGSSNSLHGNTGGYNRQDRDKRNAEDYARGRGRTPNAGRGATENLRQGRPRGSNRGRRAYSPNKGSRPSRAQRGRGSGKFWVPSRVRADSHDSDDSMYSLASTVASDDERDDQAKPDVLGKDERFSGVNRRRTRRGARGRRNGGQENDKVTESIQSKTAPELENSKTGVKNCSPADDIGKISLLTLYNRKKRYRSRLSEMKKDEKFSATDVENLEHILSKILDEIDKRNKKMDEKRNKGKKDSAKKSINTNEEEKNEEEAEWEDDEGKSEVESDTDSASTVKVEPVRRKNKHVSSKTGKISFRPKSKPIASLKQAKNKTRQMSENLSDEAEEEKNEEDAEIKKTGVKPKSEKKTKNKSSKVLKEVSVEPDEIEKVENTTQEKPQAKPRKKAKAKKCQVESSDNVASVPKYDDLLDTFDNLCLGKTESNERKDRESVDSNEKKRSSKHKNAEKKQELSDSTISQDKTENLTNKQRKNKNVKAEVGDEKQRKGQVNEPNPNEVFKFLVQKMKGECTPGRLKSESNFFPDDVSMDAWLSRNRNKFLQIRRNDDLVSVRVYIKDVSYCLDYLHVKSCRDEKCSRFHVCRDFITGFCKRSDDCRFCHDFFNEDNGNLAKCKNFGFSNIFNNEDVRSILHMRFPEVCDAWDESNVCEDNSCVKLHMCKRFLLGKCFDDDDACPWGHNRMSEHNSPIVNAYYMAKWNEKLFARIVYLPRQEVRMQSHTALEDKDVGQHKPSSSEAVQSAPVTKRKQRKFEKNAIVQQVDIFTDTEIAICEEHLRGVCVNRRCPLYHNDTQKLPYIWQVKLFGTWVALWGQSETIEEAYCGRRSKSEKFPVQHEFVELEVYIDFDPPLQAVVVYSSEGGVTPPVPARRISTASYVTVEADTTTFLTQWRWYLKGEGQEWIQFQSERTDTARENDNFQVTLEAKFLSGQTEYLFSRNNFQFLYCLDFQEMRQVNLDTQKVRKVIRRPVYVLKQMVENQISTAPLVMSKSVSKGLPEGWVPWDVTHPFELVKLGSSTTEYNTVKTDFRKTMRKTDHVIDCIYRIQNSALWETFVTREAKMTEGRSKGLEKRHLFHGTKTIEAIRSICTNNFDYRYSGENATLYGDGVYFARDAKYSHGYTAANPCTGKRFMFQALVLVGDFTLGKKEYRLPPLKPGSAYIHYDSCVNRVDDPTIFIISDKYQHYPLYLIEYHDTDSAYTTEPLPSRPIAAPRQTANQQAASRQATNQQAAFMQPASHASVPRPQQLVSGLQESRVSPENTTYPETVKEEISPVTGLPKDPYRAFQQMKFPEKKKEESCCVQ